MSAGRRVPFAAVTLAVAALLLGAAAEARGGTYDVFACGGAAGAAQNAFAAAADPGMAAYSICPATPSNVATGLVTRASATAGPGSVPYFAGAYQIFEAPPGASLVSVRFDLAAIRLAAYWTTGVVAYGHDFNIGDLPYGCYAGRSGCGIGLSAFFGPVTVPLGAHSRFRFESRCVNQGGCDISGSGHRPATRALFSAANIVVRVQDFFRPSVTVRGGSLFGGGWLRGFQHGSVDEFDNVGIMLNRAWVDGHLVFEQDFRDPSWPPWVRCDFTRRRPCSDIGGAGTDVNTRALADGAHELRVEAVDAAGNSASIVRTIRVDNTPPPRVNAGVRGGEGWRRRNEFGVSWAAPAGQASPLARTHYRLCRVGANGECTAGSRPETAGLSGLAVPQDGDYSLRVWLEDAAGNTDPDSASDPVRLRFDGKPPTGRFEPLDETDPRRIDVAVTDATSGVAGGTIELRRSGWRQWHVLPTALAGDRLSAHVDDLGLADGDYQFRARVRDHAGNELVTDRGEDGSRMVVKFPVRAASRLAIAAPSEVRRRCTRRARGRRGRRCRRERKPLRHVRGTGKTISARLERADGAAIGGAPVEVLEVLRGGVALARGATVTTDGGGRFTYRIGPGPSRTVRFRYRGTPVVRPTSAALDVRVPARTTIKVDRRFVRNGQRVLFTGRLLGGPLPEGGKLIDLQAHYRGRWRTFATPRTAAEGRWRYVYRFGATRGLVTYRFRARIRREASYPYELGRSRVVRVTVRGP